MKASKNLLNLYNQATPEIIEAGKQWYYEAYNFVIQQSMKHDVHPHIVAQVISALSPATRWEQNKIDCDRLLTAHNEGNSINATVTTYKQNHIKAIEILNGNVKLELTARKTYHFHKNLLLDTNSVTIDRHAYKALVKGTKSGAVSITKKRYDAAHQAYFNTAKHINIIPFELQAIVWLQYKENLKR